MKKLISALLILGMSLLLCIPSYAATINTDGGTASADVKGTYQAGASASVVLSVDVTWGSMEFTYTDASEGTWNPTTHTYEDIEPAAWTVAADANKITVTNHSNTDLRVNFSYTPGENYDGISGTFSNSFVDLATAVGTTVAGAPTDSTFLTLSGDLDSDADQTVIGSVTVTLDLG
ncbi:MAG: hypothetical protein WDA00_02170 [Eubacteriales bacterium]